MEPVRGRTANALAYAQQDTIVAPPQVDSPLDPVVAVVLRLHLLPAPWAITAPLERALFQPVPQGNTFPMESVRTAKLESFLLRMLIHVHHAQLGHILHLAQLHV